MAEQMWSLINKETEKIIMILDANGYFIMGFSTSAGLLDACGQVVEDWEEIRKIEFTV